MSPTIRSGSRPGRWPESSSSSPSSRPWRSAQLAGTRAPFGSSGDRFCARNESRLANGGLGFGIDADDQDRDNRLIRAREARHGDESLAHRRSRKDGGVGTKLLERPGAEAGIRECAESHVGSPEQVGGRRSHSGLR